MFIMSIGKQIKCRIYESLIRSPKCLLLGVLLTNYKMTCSIAKVHFALPVSFNKRRYVGVIDNLLLFNVSAYYFLLCLIILGLKCDIRVVILDKMASCLCHFFHSVFVSMLLSFLFVND